MGKNSASVTASPPSSRSGPNGESPPPRKKLRITIKRPPQVWKNNSDQQPYCNNDADGSGCNNNNNSSSSSSSNRFAEPQLRGQPSTTIRRPTTIHDLFDVQKLLGEGGFGKVYLAVRRCDQQVVALKMATILNNGLYPSASNCNEESLQREVSALIALSDPGHPHVCRLYNSPLRDNSHSYLAMEYIGGGELFEHLVNRGPFSEHDAAKFLRQFADALHYIHSKGYVHCDLKPENIMMGSWEKEEPRLKVVDFGFSVPDQESIKLDSYGTVAYLPPECLVKGHSSHRDPWHPNTAGDMYAVGVIMYTVLTGTHPFDRTNQASNLTIANAIVGSLASATTEYSISSSDKATTNSSNGKCSRSTNEYLDTHVFDDRTDGLSFSSIALMRGLLHSDPKQRMTSCQLRHHPWILGQTATTHCLSSGHHSKLKAFWQRRFRAAILHHRGQDRRRQTLSHKESEIVFRSMDLNGDGTVSLEELERTMLNDSSSSSIGGNMDDSGGNKVKQYMLDDLFSSIDEDGSGGIDLGEFKRVMCQKFDDNDSSSSSSSKNDCNTSSGNVGHSCDSNHNNIDEQILAISNEQVRGCIFQKFRGIEREAAWGNSQGSTNPSTRETLRIIFDTMDLNKDGFLQLSEAITVLRETPELDEDMISLWVRI
jgi:serine/threonine protein kinase